ncbi:unnamed protein product, partial [marine sediment metagenome]
GFGPLSDFVNIGYVLRQSSLPRLHFIVSVNYKAFGAKY